MRVCLLTLAVAGLLTSLPVTADYLTYLGHLEAYSAPANGRFDLRLTAHGDAERDAPLAAPIEFPAVPVTDGAFRVEFDLPRGRDEAWVELAVRAAGESVWSMIPGRTKASAAPNAIGQCWSSTGDDGSNPALNFLGTTDAQPLVLRTRNVQSLRIEPSTILFGGNPITANVIAGSSANSVGIGVRGATISGGGVPSADSDPDYGLEGPNRVTDHYGTIGGGYANVAGDGTGPLSDRPFATVAGGGGNQASAANSTVGGGGGNVASGADSVVVGGFFNTASAPLSMVAGGLRNCAGGEASWAGGRDAKVRVGSGAGASGFGCANTPSTSDQNGDEGSFLWVDAISGPVITSGPNQFMIAADGGLFLNTNVRVGSGDDVVFKARPTSGDNDIDLRLVTRSDKTLNLFVSDSTGTFVISPANVTAAGNRLSVFGGSGGPANLSNGGTWTNASSRSFKSGFAAVDPVEVLNRLLGMPITTWEYSGSGEGLHLGPVAEDFKAAFGLAGDGKSIATVDADGVAMAAIQGLNRKLENERDALRAENAELRMRLDRIERVLERID